jgi:hypothetical protein
MNLVLDRDFPESRLPAGTALDAAMQRVLHFGCEACGYHPTYIETFCGRVKPWSTNIMLTMSLIDDIRYMYLHATIVLSCTIDAWSCEITGTTHDGEDWWCEATGRTLPEAFCRAWVQVQQE